MSINNQTIFEKIKKRIKETDLDFIIKQEKLEMIKAQERVANEDYCFWIEHILNHLAETYKDESWAYRTLKWKNGYTVNENDIKKEKDLEHFYIFLSIVADIQRVKEYYDDRFFEEYEYVWKFNNKYYEWNTFVGQGSITRIRQIEKPDFAYIDLDLYFKREREGDAMEKYKFL